MFPTVVSLAQCTQFTRRFIATKPGLVILFFMLYLSQRDKIEHLLKQTALYSELFVYMSNMEHREGFEPPNQRICNPRHWTALVPVRVGWRCRDRTDDSLCVRQVLYQLS